MRIEAGKWYLNRQGNCVGPMRKNSEEGAVYLWQDGEGRYYFWDGRAGVGMDPDPHDLVKEWINPVTHPPRRDAYTPRYATPPPIPQQHKQANAAPPPPPPPPQQAQQRDATYDELIRVLKDAHAQASVGKGNERHANGRPFDRQPIMELGRMFGPGFTAGQAAKKAQEAMGMLNRQNNEAAVFELLGAINYLAACVMLVRENRV